MKAHVHQLVKALTGLQFLGFISQMAYELIIQIFKQFELLL